ncbi:MAG: TM2 domain-containing protein [Pseudanabaena sp. M34BS1SP1A06MG]|nr:TM2 domain-containing protein [Pseudanabaena sp. M34BS1SP1A06MG]
MSQLKQSTREMVMKTRTGAILWCFFLGSLGAHKFYL